MAGVARWSEVLMMRRRRTHATGPHRYDDEWVARVRSESTLRPEPFSTYRTPTTWTLRVRLLAAVTAALLVIVVVFLLLGNLGAAGLAVIIAAAPAFYFSAVLLARVRRPRVDVSDAGITVVNLCTRPTHIRWADLRDVKHVDISRDPSGGELRQLRFTISDRTVRVTTWGYAGGDTLARRAFRDRILDYRDYILSNENGGPEQG